MFFGDPFNGISNAISLLSGIIFHIENSREMPGRPVKTAFQRLRPAVGRNTTYLDGMEDAMVIIAVDDERLAIESIIKSIRSVAPEAEVHGFLSGASIIEFLESHHADVVFLDIEMRDMNGMDLASRIRRRSPRMNIVFTTGYSKYAGRAFDVRASGYILKPVTAEKIRAELENLRYPVRGVPRGGGQAPHYGAEGKRIPEYLARNRLAIDSWPSDSPEAWKHITSKGLFLRTFGNFEVFADGVPLHFKYIKTKELLAYLTDRCGALCSNREITAVLWEDDGRNHASYLKSIRADLVTVLEEHGYGNVVVRRRGGIGLIPGKVICDYYNYLNRMKHPDDTGGEPLYLESRGEYMTQYSWAEVTNSILTHMSVKSGKQLQMDRRSASAAGRLLKDF